MKKKIGLIMSMVLLFVFVFSGINNAYVAHAEKNNDFVIGTHNLNNTEKNSAKVGDKINEPEKDGKDMMILIKILVIVVIGKRVKKMV